MRVWAGLLLAVCAGASVGALKARAGENGVGREKELEFLLAGAVEDFGAGNYIAARAKLEKLLAENPTNEEAWRLREAFGDKAIRAMALWMHVGRTLGRAPEILLVRALEHDAREREKPENIAVVVDSAIRNVNNVQALHDLSILGARAAPWLIDQLRNERDENARANASFLLTQMGPPMILPLVQTLSGLLDQPEWKEDQAVLAQLTADALAGIRPRDSRALPVLKRFMEDGRRVSSAREWAARAAAIVAGMPAAQAPSASDLYYEAAQRLYMGGPLVDDEMADLSGRYYAWDENAEVSADRRGFLRSVRLPVFALNDLYAQDMIFAGMGLPGQLERFAPLLARSLLEQAFEIDEYATTAGQQGLVHPDIGRHESDATAWRKQLEENRRFARLIGPERLATALADALVDGNSTVALGALDALRRSASWNRLEGRGSILDALGYPDFRVRHKAASVLVDIGIPAGHARLSDVAEALCDGATVKTRKVVVLMMANDEQRSDLRRKLETRGVTVLATDDGSEGLRMVWQQPFKDAVFIDAEMEEFARLRRRLAEAGLIPGTALPVVVVTTEARAARMESAMYGDGVWRTVRKAISGTDPDKEAEKLYSELTAENRGQTSGLRVLALLTHESGEIRRQVRRRLQLEAEKQANPSGPSDLLRAMDLTGRSDEITAPGLRTLYANIFLDEELSSSSAMQIVQRLRQDPRSALIPLAVMTRMSRRGEADADFREFLNQGAAALRLLDVTIDGDRLLSEVEAMSLANELVKRDFQKAYFLNSALECAEALGKLPRNGAVLPEAKAALLRDALLDKPRPVEVRTAVARALGVWEESSAAKALAAVFDARGGGEEEEALESPELRMACMWALGEVDRAGGERDVKLRALSDGLAGIREEASTALSKELLSSPDCLEVLRLERGNGPAVLLSLDLGELPSAGSLAGAEGASPAVGGNDDW